MFLDAVVTVKVCFCRISAASPLMKVYLDQAHFQLMKSVACSQRLLQVDENCCSYCMFNYNCCCLTVAVFVLFGRFCSRFIPIHFFLGFAGSVQGTVTDSFVLFALNQEDHLSEYEL